MFLSRIVTTIFSWNYPFNAFICRVYVLSKCFIRYYKYVANIVNSFMYICQYTTNYSNFSKEICILVLDNRLELINSYVINKLKPSNLYSFKIAYDYIIFTAALSMAGCLVRVFTTLQLTNDKLALIGYLVGFITNGILFGQVIFYNYFLK